MAYITLFGLQLFMAACSSSAIIKRVAGHSVCVFNPYSFRMLIIWKDFLMRKRIQPLMLMTFYLAPKQQQQKGYSAYLFGPFWGCRV